MKILFISNMFPNKSHPGHGVFVKKHYDLLIENGIDVDLAVKYKSSNGIINKLLYINLYFNILFNVIFNNYDIVYVHYISHTAPIINLLSKFKKINLYLNCHGSDILVNKKVQNIFVKSVTEVIKRCEYIVVPSEFFRNIVKERYGINDEKIFISPSGGVDFEVFNYSQKDNSGFKIGFVGRMVEGKGWRSLIYAVKELKEKNILGESKIYIVGSGDDDDKCDSLIEELGLIQYIIRRPAADQNTLSNYYSDFDIFIFPTLFMESLGLVGLEAMACGTPIITTNLGGIKDYFIEGYNGFSFEADNSEDLARAIYRYMNLTSCEKVRMQKNAYETALKFDKKIVNKKMIEFINKK